MVLEQSFYVRITFNFKHGDQKLLSKSELEFKNHLLNLFSIHIRFLICYKT